MRTIKYTIGVDSISPSTVQFGGFAGEDNVTTLEFSFSDELAAVIEGYKPVHYLLEVRDSSGAYDAFPVEPPTVDEKPVLTFLVPEDITLLSGKVILQLSIVKLDENSNQERKLFTYPVRLRFLSSASGGVRGSSEYEQYFTGVVGAMKRAEAAATDAVNAKNAANSARDDAVVAKEQAESAALSAAENAQIISDYTNKAGIYAESAFESVESAKRILDDIDDLQSATNHNAERAEIAEKAAQRYAVGGTGTDESEDTDNAKYYCNQAFEYQQAASLSAGDAFDYKETAQAAADRAEAAAAVESWIHLKTVTLDEAKHDPNEKTADMGDTTKGLRVKVTLPANTVLPNNRLTAYFSLNNSRQIVVRAEGWAKDESNPTVCIYEVRPFAGVWNAETFPYSKAIASVSGDVTWKQGDDSVRYLKLLTNEDNPLPVGTKMEFWGLE